AALLNFTRMLADEGKEYGIRVNGISPGPTKTARWNDLVLKMSETAGKDPVEWEKEFLMKFPLRRLAEPDEIANLAAFLASDKACYVHGTVVTIDGGLTKCI
ncbi:MAG TPA: short-chain dehydrogenase, partial [Desulfobacteraceae bacterium]|nr:short-chain dehydrogenase [Desulfobacteraceae bacterium]